MPATDSPRASKLILATPDRTREFLGEVQIRKLPLPRRGLEMTILLAKRIDLVVTDLQILFRRAPRAETSLVQAKCPRRRFLTVDVDSYQLSDGRDFSGEQRLLWPCNRKASAGL
jgi:hypothetical protein